MIRLELAKQAIIHIGKGSSYTTTASTHLYWAWSWDVSHNTGDRYGICGRFACAVVLKPSRAARGQLNSRRA